MSKKLEGQLLSPTLTEESKVAYPEDFVKLYSLFNSRNMMIRSAKLIYRASENGSATSFYNRCNGVPNCVALVKTSNNKLVGGFTPLPLVHHDSDQLEEELCGNDQTKTSFIFSLSSLKSFSLRDCSKAIIYRKGSCGPQFS